MNVIITLIISILFIIGIILLIIGLKINKAGKKRITKNTSIIRRKGMESGLPVGACYRN